MVMRATPSAPTSMTVLPFTSLPIMCLSAMIHNLSLSLASMGNDSDQYHTQVCWAFNTLRVNCRRVVFDYCAESDVGMRLQGSLAKW